MNNYKNWPELLALCILIIGFIFGVTSLHSSVMFLFISFLFGLTFGRIWFKNKEELKYPTILGIIAFLFGFILSAALLGYINTIIYIPIIFFIGVFISFYLHERKYLPFLDF
jgi:uncharacterized membrane protein AbrB (regulator of aidB expression)